MSSKNHHKDGLSFGKRLRLVRKESGFSQEALAKALSIAPTTVGRYENDERIPDVELVNSLVRLLDCDIAWLLTGKGEPFPQSGAAADVGQEYYNEDDIILKMIEQLKRIYNEKDFKKLATLQSLLNLADPAEADEEKR